MAANSRLFLARPNPSSTPALFYSSSYTSSDGYGAEWSHCTTGTGQGSGSNFTTSCGGFSSVDLVPRTSGSTDAYGNGINRGGDQGMASVYGQSGFGEQILAAANHSGGAGGYGQRHYMAPGDDQNTGGLAITFATSKTQLWCRWYQRWLKSDGTAGFAWDHAGHPGMYQKSLYFNVGSVNGFYIVGFHTGSEAWYTAVSTNGAGSNIDSSTNFSNLGDGNWHCLEVYMKTDTNGSNGELAMWADNVNVLPLRTNINYNAQNFTHVLVGSNQYWPAQNGYTDFDDMAMSSVGRIGPL